MCPRSPLELYAEEICLSAKIISVYCQSSDRPHPSFDVHEPLFAFPSSVPRYVLSARHKLHSAAAKIQQLATEPSEYLSNISIHYQTFACIHWLCHFRILYFIPLQGSVPYREVAILANVPETSLKSIARTAMLSNFLRESTPGELSHSSISTLFVINPSLLDWALFAGEAGGPAAASLVAATERWGVTSQKNQTAFNLVKTTDLPFSEYVAQSPRLTKQLQAYKNNVFTCDGFSVDHLVHDYDWASLGDTCVVEIGDCQASIALATCYPRLRFIAQYDASIPCTFQDDLSKLPESQRSRISTQSHNIFSTQPVKGAGVYLLRRVLGDKATSEAIAILQNLVPALIAKATAPPACIIVMDIILPPPGCVPTTEEATLRAQDLNLMETCNRHERELSDWSKLFDQAGDSNASLVLKRVTKPEGSYLSLMELVLREQSGVLEARVEQPVVDGINALNGGSLNEGNVVSEIMGLEKERR